MRGFQPYATHAMQGLRKERKDRNVSKNWLMAWLEFITWYGYRSISLASCVFWNLDLALRA